MRYAKLLCVLLLVLVTTTAGAAPRDDDQRQTPIQRVIAFLKHIVSNDDPSEIHVPIP